MTFTNGLPSFCASRARRVTWSSPDRKVFEPVDVVTAKVLYEDGREKYSEITVGGKRTNKSMMEIGGTTSTGEFASYRADSSRKASEPSSNFINRQR